MLCGVAFSLEAQKNVSEFQRWVGSGGPTIFVLDFRFHILCYEKGEALSDFASFEEC